MGLTEIIITPIYMGLFTIIALFIRPYVTNSSTYKYFLPALWIRFGGAIALGIIYQFYYGGGFYTGDTFNYYSQSSVIYQAFQDDFLIGLKLLFANGEYQPETFKYTSKIQWYAAPAEYFIIRILGLFSLVTFNSYTSGALFFACFNFAGLWMMFSALSHKMKEKTRVLAIGVLFIPSTIFWGSGILKDTLTLGALGMLFWACFKIIEEEKFVNFKIILVGVFSSWILVSVKIYVLICFLPALFVWVYLKSIRKVKLNLVKWMIAPILISFFLVSGFFLTNALSSKSDRYRLDTIAEWTYITAYDIRYWTGKDAGSGYDLGNQDGTWITLLKLAPAAINVSLFRPYLWEVKNPLMLLAGIESLVFLIFTLINIPALVRRRKSPLTIFMLVFAITFAFAVGVSTYNFGTLSRYKLPMLPFYAVAIISLKKTKELR